VVGSKVHLNSLLLEWSPRSSLTLVHGAASRDFSSLFVYWSIFFVCKGNIYRFDFLLNIWFHSFYISTHNTRNLLPPNLCITSIKPASFACKITSIKQLLPEKTKDYGWSISSNTIKTLQINNRKKPNT